jgi:hypothetical protein
MDLKEKHGMNIKATYFLKGIFGGIFERKTKDAISSDYVFCFIFN